MYEALPGSLPPVLGQPLPFYTQDTFISGLSTQTRREPHQPLPIPYVGLHPSPAYTDVPYY